MNDIRKNDVIKKDKDKRRWREILFFFVLFMLKYICLNFLLELMKLYDY